MYETKRFSDLPEFRRSVLFRHTTLPCSVLEIGAYAMPTVLPSECELRVLDYYDTQQLRDSAQKAGINPDKVVPVDYCCRDDNYSAVVPRTFDLVIANHVWEHTDRSIVWLQTVRALLREDGLLLLVLPDKKYSFDKYRPDTPFTHLLFEYLAPDLCLKGLHALETAMLYDMQYIGRTNDLAHKLNIDHLRRSLQDRHPGIHTHIFQGETFERAIVKPILYTRLADFHLREITVYRPFGEFAVVLGVGAREPDMTAEDLFTPAGDTVTAETCAASATLARGGQGSRILSKICSSLQALRSLLKLAR